MSSVPVARQVDPDREPATLRAMESVMGLAFGSGSYRASITRFGTVQPDGLVVVEVDGRVVGTGCGIAYPDAGFGWIGLIATRPDFERRGIGTLATTRVIEVLAAHGCAPVLDASGPGAPVYARMGFRDHGPTRVLIATRPRPPATSERLATAPADAATSSVAATGATAPQRAAAPVGATAPAAEQGRCRLVSEADLEAIVAYDAERFGAERGRLIVPLVRQHRTRALVVRDADDEVVGYAVAQPRSLAPMIADDETVLGDLLAATSRLDWDEGVRIDVPFESGHVDVLRAGGFAVASELRNMRRDIDRLPGRRHCIAGQVSLGEG